LKLLIKLEPGFHGRRADMKEFTKLAKVIWITGLSGAGKTTIAKEIIRILNENSIVAVLIDGDDFRKAISDPGVAYDSTSRLVNAYRISRFAKMIYQQNIVTVVATMSLFHEIHEWNRQNIDDYFEVYLKTDISLLKQNDIKKLYGKVNKGIEENLPGIDIPYEEPLFPDLIIHNAIQEKSVTKISINILKNTQILDNNNT